MEPPAGTFTLWSWLRKLPFLVDSHHLLGDSAWNLKKQNGFVHKCPRARLALLPRRVPDIPAPLRHCKGRMRRVGGCTWTCRRSTLLETVCGIHNVKGREACACVDEMRRIVPFVGRGVLIVMAGIIHEDQGAFGRWIDSDTRLVMPRGRREGVANDHCDYWNTAVCRSRWE